MLELKVWNGFQEGDITSLICKKCKRSRDVTLSKKRSIFVRFLSSEGGEKAGTHFRLDDKSDSELLEEIQNYADGRKLNPNKFYVQRELFLIEPYSCFCGEKYNLVSSNKAAGSTAQPHNYPTYLDGRFL